MGEIGLRWKGINFAKQQLYIGTKCFSNIYAADTLDTFLDFESEEDEDDMNDNYDELVVSDSDDD